MTALDARDRKLLELLRADAWLTYAALAARVNLSASAVQRRVERMLADGVLLGAEARIDARALGRPLTLFALLELRDDREATIRQFCKELGALAAVAEAHYVTGEADVLLTLRVADMDEYAQLVERHFNGSPLVRRFKTFTSIRALK